VNNRSDISNTSQTGPVVTAWCVAALLVGAIVNLIHDPEYATARGADTVESGRSIRQRSVMEEGLDVAPTARLVGMGMLMSAGALCLITARGARVSWDGLSWLVVLLIAWTIASYFWSIDRETTARELLRLAIYTGTAASMALRFDVRWLCYVIVITLGGSAACAVGFEVMTGGFRPWVTDYRLAGSLHSNVLGVQAAVVAILAYAFALRRDPRAVLWWTVFSAALAVVLLTRARTAVLTVAGGMLAVHMVGRSLRDCAYAAAVATSIAAAGLLAAGALGRLRETDLQQIKSMGRTDQTEALTGRVPLWQFVMRRTEERRLQGFGWGAFWLIDRTLDAHHALGWFPRHSHNAFLHVAADLGAVGLAMVALIGMWSLVRAASIAQETGQQEYRAIAAMFVGIFINGMAESAFAMPRDMGLFTAAAVFSLIVVHEGWATAVERRVPSAWPVDMASTAKRMGALPS
jgi:O-antigen ligase